jgi:hypothetical protein
MSTFIDASGKVISTKEEMKRVEKYSLSGIIP